MTPVGTLRPDAQIARNHTSAALRRTSLGISVDEIAASGPNPFRASGGRYGLSLSDGLGCFRTVKFRLYLTRALLLSSSSSSSARRASFNWPSARPLSMPCCFGAAAASAAGGVCTCASAGGVAENTEATAPPSARPARRPPATPQVFDL